MLVNVVGWMSLGMSAVSLLCFVYLAIVSRPSRTAPKSGLGEAEQHAGLSDVAKLVEAISKLSDSFARGGPLVMSMVGAIVFLLISLLASGLAAARLS